MMDIDNRPYGYSMKIMERHGVAVHAMFVQKGGFSSQHVHKLLNNRLIVISGKIVVYTWDDPKPGKAGLAKHIYAAGLVNVPAGTWHCFEALEDSVVVEMYWNPEATADPAISDPTMMADIVRITKNGIKASVGDAWDRSTADRTAVLFGQSQND